MKLYILTISLILGHGVLAQVPKDSSESSSWDSLFFMHKQTKKFYNDILSKEYLKSDTLITKDSLVITMISKTGFHLQKIVNSLDQMGCEKHIKHTYFNQLGLPAYIENYSKKCPKRITKSIYDKEFIHVYYERIEYDKDRRIVLRVFNISTPKTIKEIYFTDKFGNRQLKRQVINETDFWK